MSKHVCYMCIIFCRSLRFVTLSFDLLNCGKPITPALGISYGNFGFYMPLFCLRVESPYVMG